jgi:hypothetical protein
MAWRHTPKHGAKLAPWPEQAFDFLISFDERAEL